MPAICPAAIIASLENLCQQAEAMTTTLNKRPADVIARFAPLFQPRSVAFLGASSDPKKWGFRVLANLAKGGFEGRIYPVNPRQEDILGLKVYSSVAGIPESPDLAIIVVPPSATLGVVEDCVNKGIKAAVVITAGFAEVGEDGSRLQDEIVRTARKGGMIMVGPNCFGLVNPYHKLYPQMPSIFPSPGQMAIVSQSGNAVFTLARLAMSAGFGISKGISIGNEADLHSEDYLEYLAQDPQTKVILSYIEGFKDGRRFFSVASEVTRKKPIVMIKAGETSAGARAARSHTASLAGADAVFEGMCRQSGIIRIRELDELLRIGLAFQCHPVARGRRVGIVTVGGGWGVLAADACARLGLDVVPLPPDVLKELDSFLPAWWSRNNPVDLVAGAFGDAMMRCVEVLLRSPSVDGVIMLGLIPETAAQPVFSSPTEEEKERRRHAILEDVLQSFGRITKISKTYDKPVIVASEHPLSGSFTQRIARALGQMNYTGYIMPHQAAEAFAGLSQYGEYLKLEGPSLKKKNQA